VAESVGVNVRNPKRTSYGALEVDAFCSSRGDFDLFLSAVGPLADIQFIRDLNIAPPHKTDSEVLSEARGLFNEERYWECHEVLEGLWRQKQGGEKRLLQGLILVCAAFVHHQKSEGEVALGILKRALQQLEFPSPSFGGLDVVTVKENVQRILQSGRFSEFRI
jgi:hypothetical protein